MFTNGSQRNMRRCSLRAPCSRHSAAGVRWLGAPCRFEPVSFTSLGSSNQAIGGVHLGADTMTYEAEINRSNPACLLLLIDQSWSMSEEWTSAGSTKAQALAFAVNRLLSNSVLLCTKGAGRVYDYFDVGVIGYGQDVGPALAGSSQARPLLPISQLADAPLRVDSIPRKVPDGAGGLVEVVSRMPIWLDPTAAGGTPMVHALTMATDVVNGWCRAHPNSFPPMVVNITDGESTDGDPRPAAQALQRIGTADGSTLLFNLHLSSSQVNQILLPSDPTGLPTATAVVLFECSSLLPESLSSAAENQGFAPRPGARGFMYNADAAGIIEFLNLGTRAVTPGGLKELEQGSNLG